MSDSADTRRLLSTFTQEGLNTLKLESACDEEEQRLIDCWTAAEAVVYFTNLAMPNTMYQDKDLALQSYFDKYISSEIIETYLLSGEIVLLIAVGPRYKSISIGALDREYLVAAMTNIDWAYKACKNDLTESTEIDFILNSRIDSTQQRLAVNRLTTFLHECRQWNLNYERDR